MLKIKNRFDFLFYVFFLSLSLSLGVKYSQLIMEMGRGTRVILNDVDPENPELPRAIGINLKRDEGLKDIEIPSYISPYESN